MSVDQFKVCLNDVTSVSAITVKIYRKFTESTELKIANENIE